MLKGLKNNEHGIILMTVLMIILVLMVLTVSMVSMNMNQVFIAESEIRRIQAESLATGVLAYMHATQLNLTPPNSTFFNETIGSYMFNVLFNIDRSPTNTIFNTDTVNIIITY